MIDHRYTLEELQSSKNVNVTLQMNYILVPILVLAIIYWFVYLFLWICFCITGHRRGAPWAV